MRRTEYLLDSLPDATVTAPASEYVGIQTLAVGRDTRMGLFQHPPSAVLLPPLSLGARPILQLAYGIKEAAWSRIRTAVQFEASVVDADGAERRLFRATLDPAGKRRDRRWHNRVVKLTRWAGQTVRLRLLTALAGEDASYAWAGWAELRVEHDLPVAPSPRRHGDRHRHVLLMTADALRRDHLGCYGNATVRTPHLDRLAADGCLALDARSQSTSTLGAYATLLTGRSPLEHGVLAEWGELPRRLDHLPQQLARKGYRTVLAFSEAELGQPGTGFPPMFDDVLPSLGRPAQSGDFTARAFRRWLDRRPDQPFFAWVQFFDAHPPCIPPEPFRSMYYRGDPADPARQDRPELVASIRGVESVADVRWELERPLDEPIDAPFIERLEATADVLMGARTVGPDLAEHLVALGPAASLGMARREFGAWLLQEVAELRRGRASTALRTWLESLLPALHDIEAPILGWLRDVQDARYPLSQYMSQVSYLDHHVGDVLDALRERDLYEQTLVVFTAPHGEILSQAGIVFDHHSLTEDVLRVPLLIKPGAGPGPRPGTRLSGIFDTIDVAPTIFEALGLPDPPGLPGAGRWPNACTGVPIPEHDSFAVDMCGAMLALTRPPHVFLKARMPYGRARGWRWREGESALFRLEEPMRYAENLVETEPALAVAFEQRLTAWLASMHSVPKS